MKAFVKTTKGTFPNVNFYLAWEAFNTLGYSVTCFEEEDIGALDVSPTTPLFAGVKIFRQVLDKMGVNYPPFDCYPEILNPYYGRNLRRSTVGEERKKFLKDGVAVFVKPVEPKKFLGHVWNSMLNLIPITNIADDTPCYVCEPIDIVSEFRVYVMDEEILGVKHYWGEWNVVPSEDFIKTVIRAYKNAPKAYGVDIAVTRNPDRDIVMEVNDGCNLGNYGLDSIHYGEMIVSRWFDIMAASKISSDLKKLIEEETAITRLAQKSPELYTWWKPDDAASTQMDKPMWEGTHKTPRECRILDEYKRLKEKSMAAFAKDIQQQLQKDHHRSQNDQDKQLTEAIESVPLTLQTVVLNMSPSPITGRIRQLIGNFTIDRDEFWKLTDAQRQALYDTHAPGTKAPKFDPRFAEKYGKNPNGPF